MGVEVKVLLGARVGSTDAVGLKRGSGVQKTSLPATSAKSVQLSVQHRSHLRGCRWRTGHGVDRISLVNDLTTRTHRSLILIVQRDMYTNRVRHTNVMALPSYFSVVFGATEPV